MKGKQSPIIFGLTLIGLITLIWWFFKKEDSTPLNTTQDTLESIKDISDENDDKHLKNTTGNASPTPTFSDTTDKQKEFSKRVDSLVKITEKCQKDVEVLFPVDSLEGPSKIYKNFPKLKEAILKFYKIVADRTEKSNEIMGFIESIPENEIPPERLFSQLSSVEDCGEFEEEAIIDQAMTSATEYKWAPEQKRELTQLIISTFDQQLQGNLGLHQLSSKIEVLHNLVDEGFLSSKFNQEITTLDQTLENAETEFRQSIPLDFSEKKLPSLKDVIDIKNAEKDATEKVKSAMQDVFSNIKSQTK